MVWLLGLVTSAVDSSLKASGSLVVYVGYNENRLMMFDIDSAKELNV